MKKLTKEQLSVMQDLVESMDRKARYERRIAELKEEIENFKHSIESEIERRKELEKVISDAQGK